ncbi:MAG: CobQ/CobB/MinD/ParA nucleotide binding domain protein [Pelotomaculum sp. PtaB.Bin104]|nr:MAG: CobQ/CobB/MinD/ParA nucleotide binding domain protein [Pelotomaculum sp. PtaB.Bin104]
MGKTTLLTSLAALAALYCPNRRPVVIADFSEFPKAPTMLGFRLVEALIGSEELFPTAMTWPDTVEQKEALESLTLRHNIIQNLHILPGSVVAGEKPDCEKLAGIIKVLQRNFELVFIDLPKDPDTVIPLCDAILVVLTANYLSLEGMFQLMPVLERLSVQDRIIPVLNRVSSNALDPEQSRRLLRKFMIEVEFEGFIPEVPRLHLGIEKDRQPYMLSKADSQFTTEVRQLLSVLCPDWGFGKKQDSGGVASLLKRFIGS